MRCDRPNCLPRWSVAGLAATLAASSLLVGQVYESQPKPRQQGQSEPVTTQPVTAVSTEAQPDADRVMDAARLVARKDLISRLIGSKHDFTEEGKEGRDLCLPCHTPHLVSPPPPRLDRRPTTTQPLRPYQNLNLQLSGWSLLCLGCHDGVVAQDVYSSAHAVTVVDQLGSSRLGTRGLRSHPVGIKYPAARDGLLPRAAVEAAGLPLPDGRIQCTTCHDAHNTYGYGGMLKISNERSRLCLTCHRL